MNQLKKDERVPLLNFEGGPRVPLLNFEEGPGYRVPGLRDREFWGVGPTFTPCLHFPTPTPLSNLAESNPGVLHNVKTTVYSHISLCQRNIKAKYHSQ